MAKKKKCEICKKREGKAYLIMGDNAECVWACRKCAERLKGL